LGPWRCAASASSPGTSIGQETAAVDDEQTIVDERLDIAAGGPSFPERVGRMMEQAGRLGLEWHGSGRIRFV